MLGQAVIYTAVKKITCSNDHSSLSFKYANSDWHYKSIEKVGQYCLLDGACLAFIPILTKTNNTQEFPH